MSLTLTELRQLRALQAVDERSMLEMRSIPLTLPSAANLREHHAVKAKRVKAQRRAVAYALAGWRRLPPLWLLAGCDLVVRMVRVAPRELDDDNLAGALKAVRDAVAEVLGVDDRDPRVGWVCAQEKGKAQLRIEVYPWEAP